MYKVISTFTKNNLTAVFRLQEQTNTVELLLVPAGSEKKIVRSDYEAEPLIQIKLLGDDYAASFSQGRTMRNSPSVKAMRYQHQAVTQSSLETCVKTTLTDDRGYRYIHTLRLFSNSPSAETETTFINESEAPVTLEMLSGFALGGLSPFSQGLAAETLNVYRMRSTWSAEGRLICESAEDLQLEPSWKNYSANSIRFGSVGSFPVRAYVPAVAIEDKENKITFAAAATQASSWQIELYRRDNGLSISGGLADREFGQWTKTIQPQQQFTTPKAVITAVFGGPDEAFGALAENTRKSLNLPVSEKDLPIIFNEFCTTWGVPTQQSVLSQIEALRGKNIEYYVIDAGWFDDKAFEAASRLGKWEVSKKAFPKGIKPIVDAIHHAGMKAGIWFEFEVAGRDEVMCFSKTDWLLCRDGLPITSGDRRFWDMRKPEVQAYLTDRVITFLQENGFDYVKVDYNENIGVGCDGAESLGEGLRAQIQASQQFFARLRKVLPNIVLEVCASGGHRLCHSFLELSCMASFSDAHECDEIPIIAANMHRIMLPMQSQIWAVVKPNQPLKKLYYQICSGLLGRLCFSGSPELLSAIQWEIIEKGIAFYRQIAMIIKEGKSTRLGTPVVSYRAPKGWQAVMRTGQAYTLLVVHTFAKAPVCITLPAAGEIISVFGRSDIDITLKDKSLKFCNLLDFDGVAVLIKNEKI